MSKVQTIPGLTGFTYARVASMDKRAVGKLTDANHLESFHSTEPADYDKKIISLYTQSSLYSNDFLDMILLSKGIEMILCRISTYSEVAWYLSKCNKNIHSLCYY